MGPLHRITSLFNTSALDLNNNGALGDNKKKQCFNSDLNIFRRDGDKIKAKALWTSMRLSRKNKGKKIISF